MTIVDLLSHLKRLDIQVFAEGDRLHCNAPEGVLTPELRDQLTAHKAELLTVLQSSTLQLTHPPIQPIARGSFLPLSFAQQRLWFLSQLAPENPFYNVPTAVRLCGHLKLEALEQAFNEIVRRHEALRTTFKTVAGQPVQVITPPRQVAIPVIDLQTVPANEREAIAQQLATEEAQHPFQLSTDPLLRVKVLKLHETEHILLLTLHHIVSDGWSLGVLIRELVILYTAWAQGEPAELPALPIQYADFAHWQREWLKGEVLETQLAYWQQQLQDIPMLNLPIDRPRPPMQSFQGTTEAIALSPELTQALEALSQQEGVSLFMTLLAAFQTLLYRYTGQDDIAVGSPIANRHRSELEGLIGFFVNSLVLRTHLSGNPTFRELLSRVRDVALGAYAHQDLPFEKLVEALDPDRDLSRNPLFQVAFALQNAPVQPFELPGLILKPLRFDPGTTRFDLEFHLWEPTQGLSHLWQAESSGLTGFVSYSTDLFDRATIVRLIQHFQTLLEAIVTNPDARLADLPILTLAERQQLWMDWNQTQVEYDREACFHHLFESQAAQNPNALAVVFEHEQLTYGELNQRANQLAHYLQSLGVRPNTLVGVCVDRSLDMVVSLLGILKAGGVYVPLAPNYPGDRLQFMLADTQVPIVLIQSALLERLPASQAQVVCCDRLQSLLENQSQEAPLSEVTAEDLAYVIYTSGSTGQPKGVLLRHRGLCNVVTAQQQIFDFSPHSRILQFSSLSFDASIFEMVMALGSGSTLLIPPPEARLPGTALIQFLRDNAITHAILPPAVLAVLPPDDLPALQTLISGGDACSKEIVDRWAVGRQFFNAYGPTETTIWATAAQLTPAHNKPTIGRPVANTQIYILDAQKQPVPIGVAGELYIGGDGLAQGYLNRPELTAEKFIIPSPLTPLSFSPLSPSHSSPLTPPSSPLYKTGDLARYLPNGNIEFLGRVDDQVKIRGFRIELGEIETVLSQHPAVRETVTLAHTDPTGDKQLVAYFTLHPEAGLQAEQQLQTQQIQHWQTLYNQTYQQANNSDPTFDIIGWHSSYTGEPIPAEQMREWVRDRVQQILALKPQRVLEIGCGTGLLLFQLAPYCTEYWGTDFSQASLDSIQQQLATHNLAQVKLFHQLANDFDNLEPAFDVVILNSVVQYFPNVDYLMQVLEGAMRVVAPGGVIFVGDVRSLPLLSAFHAAVQLHQADADLERSQLRQQVQRSLFEEPELVIDPAFFDRLQMHFPQIRHVRVQLSRGRHLNELTQFRYNVVLQVASENQQAGFYETQNSEPCIDWAQHPHTVADIRQRLSETQPDVLRITNIANSRVIKAVQTAEWLSQPQAPKTVEQMRTTLETLSEQAIAPQDWWDLESQLPYTVQVSWSSFSSEGRYDVVFVRHGVKTNIQTSCHYPDLSRPWTSYTNRPLQAQLARQLVPQLRHHLEQKLPDYMVPAAFVALETLPLNPNGKVDRAKVAEQYQQSLLATATQPERLHAYVAPRSPLEETLVKIWVELLRLKQVGIHANFFELGGHSLLATQLASRLRDAFEVEVPLRTIFEAPTIAQLAQVIATLQANTPQTQAPALVKLDRSSHRRLRSSLPHSPQGE